MKKLLLILVAVLVTVGVMAEAKYTIIARDNDTVRMIPNALGSAIKSALPGAKNEAQYRLIKKVDKGKESYIFIDFVRTLDKIMVAYESAPSAPDWTTTIIGQKELYEAVTRVNDIYLKGSLLGMSVEIFQRPLDFQDIVNVDGYEFPLPFKIAVYETKGPSSKPKTLKELVAEEKAQKEANNE